MRKQSPVPSDLGKPFDDACNEERLAGQQTNGTGLQYLRARYMDPETGQLWPRRPLIVPRCPLMRP